MKTMDDFAEDVRKASEHLPDTESLVVIGLAVAALAELVDRYPNHVGPHLSKTVAFLMGMADQALKERAGVGL